MEYPFASIFIVSFCISLLYPCIWLIICKLLPRALINLKFCYGIAMMLAVSEPVYSIVREHPLAIYGITIQSLAALTSIGILIWLLRRAILLNK